MQGTFPEVATRWPNKAWRQFGRIAHAGPTPGVDAHLFQRESFLVEDDMALLERAALVL